MKVDYSSVLNEYEYMKRPQAELRMNHNAKLKNYKSRIENRKGQNI